jgi:hypothetical protein
MGIGETTPFWEAHWLSEKKPEVIAPLIYVASSRKKWNAKQTLSNND